MKKVITILAILALVVGFAFATVAGDGADGSHTLRINADVNDQYPTFRLDTTGYTGTAGSDYPTSGNFAILKGASDTLTIDTNDMLTKNAVLAFAIVQPTDSRCTANYHLKVTATDLILDGVTGTPGTDEKFTVSLSTAFATTASVTNVITVTPKQSTDTGFAGTDGGFDVAYLNGKYIDAGTTERTLGTFAYTWAANNTAKVGDYGATVTLNVEAF